MKDLASIVSRIVTELNIPINLPYIGSTSIWKIIVFLSLVSMLTSFILGIFGYEADEEGDD